MSTVYECDICGETFERTYVDKGYTESARKGADSAKVVRSFRRRLLRWLIGAPLVLKVFGSGRHRWHRKDICRSCMRRLKREVQDDD